MSMERCVECSRPIDTDFDVECYDEDGTNPMCEYCRDKLEREQEEDNRLDDPRHGQAAFINRGR